MKTFYILIIIFATLCNCGSNKSTPDGYESETLKIKPISDRVFLHVTYLETNDFGKVACNGMIYFSEKEAFVFDTPTNDEVSNELIGWIEEQNKRIVGIVATHYHNDCVGGLKAFHDKDIKSYASNKTIAFITQDSDLAVPKNSFENEIELKVGSESVFLKFFGEGHTVDNIVGHIPSEKTLFGGCLVKSVNANKGYLGDANTAEWSSTVEQIKKDISDLKVVVPGHGEHGGTELLDYTIRLFKEKQEGI